ncbi:hypothetical protein PENSPDRAFT_648825 [Peniophora sp. CONT]|nr:hypothetical protein PENSPDRAFT_648825 [Peniophora sp. CONT]
MNQSLAKRLILGRQKHKAAALLTFPPLVALAMFILFSAYWALGVYLLWAEVYTFLPNSQATLQGVDSRWIYRPSSAPLYVQEVLQVMMIMLGDIVSLWRAYAIYGRPRWLYAVFGSILIIETIASTFFCAALAVDYLPLPQSSILYPFLDRTKALWFLLAYLVTDLAQGAATVSIAYKTWAHWRDVREFINRSPTRNSLVMLVVILESGVIYLALLGWYGYISWYGRLDSAIWYTSAYYMSPIIAMYPTLVVVLVSMRHSVLERSINSVLPVSFGMQFAERPSMHVHQDSDVSSSYRPSGEHEALLQGDPEWLQVSFGPPIGMDSVFSALNKEIDSGTVDHSQDDIDIVVLEKPRRALLYSSDSSGC